MTELYENSRAILKGILSEYRHYPNSNQQDGLDDLLLHFSMMAEGGLPKKYHISSLDPGVGKTMAVVSFLKALSDSENHKCVGALVGFSRKNEIEAIIEGLRLLQIPQSSFAVLVSANDENNELRAHGSDNPATAQILLTTHQMIIHRTFEVSFEGVPAFWYQGSPRAIRIWDEGLLPASPLCLSSDQIAETLRDLQAYPNERKRLLALQSEIEKASDGDTIDLAATVTVFGEGDFRVIQDERNSLSLATRSILRSLVSMQFSEPVVRVYLGVPYLVGYADILPNDLAPMVILDASGRVRHTYKLWEENRGSLVRLKTAVKDYSKLTVHVWDKGGGKSSIKKKPYSYAAAIGEAINSAPEARWLIVYHKPKSDDGYDLKTLVENTLNGDALANQSRIDYLTWGNHTATNAFADVDHIILAGTLFYRTMDYEAHASAGSGKGLLGPVDVKLRDETQLGESLDQLLQAACRGSVRKMTDGTAHACDVYLIADLRRGIADNLEHVFPGCQIVPWVPEPLTLNGKAKELVDIVVTFFDIEPLGTFKFSKISNAIGMKSSQLSKLRQHPSVREALNERRIKEYQQNLRANCYHMEIEAPEVADTVCMI